MSFVAFLATSITCFVQLITLAAIKSRRDALESFMDNLVAITPPNGLLKRFGK